MSALGTFRTQAESNKITETGHKNRRDEQSVWTAAQ